MTLGDEVMEFALAVLLRTREHDVKYPAAAVAYYGFVAFLPLVVLGIALLDEAALSRFEDALPRLLAPQARRLVYESVAVASGRTGATLFAVAVFAWSGANMAGAFRTIVERVEGRADRTRDTEVRVAAGVFASLCLAVLSVGAVEWFVTRAVPPLFVWLRPGVMLLALTAAFSPLYFVASEEATDLRTTLPGAFTAALGWSTIVTGVQFYAANAAQYALYGILSGVILIFTCLYLAAGALMFGVVVNATAADWRA